MNLSKLSWHIIEGLIRQLQDAVFVITNNKFIYVNDKLCALVEREEEELLGLLVFDLVHPDDRQVVEKRNQLRIAGQQVEQEYSFRVITKSGDSRLVHINVDLLHTDSDTNVIIGSLRDITETNRYRIDLEESRKEILNILNNLPDVFYRTDAMGAVIYISPSVYDCLGYQPEEMYGKPLADFYLQPTEREKIVNALIAGKGKAKHVEAWLRHKDGTPVWVSTNAYIRVNEEGQSIGVEGIARDITERKNYENELAKLANHDSLTGLATRNLVMEHLKSAMAIAKRNQTKVAIFYSDLDGFKHVNDTYGHTVGDVLLQQVASRINSNIREMDIAGRLGGDEFLIILSGLKCMDEAVTIANTLLDSIQQEFIIEGITITVGLSIGISIYPDNDEDAKKLLIKADTAMYESKHNGKNQITFC